VTTQGDLVAIMRDLLDDQDDSMVDLSRKGRLLNMGLAAMFPRIYIYLRDSTMELVEDQFEYAMPVTFLVGTAAGSTDRDRKH
jgi:hypothetical protein